MTAPAFAERVGARALDVGITLTALELRRLEQYYALLERWNETINLTGLPLRGYPDRTIDRLLIEPLSAAALVADSPITWFDLGSGGGSPAIPLKIVRPLTRLTMVEAKQKKAAFLREAMRAVDLPDVDVLQQRFEELAAGHHADLVTVRAVRIDDALIRACSTLLRPAGRLLLFSTSAFAGSISGFRRQETLPLRSGSVINNFSKLAEAGRS